MESKEYEIARQATPHSVLIDELMDSRVPKTEREHAAYREIEMLRARINMNNDETELKECVKELFEKYLNRVEDSESGKLFNPVTIGSCRVMLIKPLNELLERIRKLSGAGPNPLFEEEINNE